MRTLIRTLVASLLVVLFIAVMSVYIKFFLGALAVGMLLFAGFLIQELWYNGKD